jgi:3-dehydroquinate dehydratase-2
MLKIAIINGPNLNLTGQREPEIYGSQNFDALLLDLKNAYANIEFSYFQSNVEGEIINELHQKGFSFDGILLNAGAYTHTSIAIADAIKAIKTPVIEVHMSNILNREIFRHTSLIGVNCIGCIMGFGMDSYKLAVEQFSKMKV